MWICRRATQPAGASAAATEPPACHCPPLLHQNDPTGIHSNQSHLTTRATTGGRGGVHHESPRNFDPRPEGVIPPAPFCTNTNSILSLKSLFNIYDLLLFPAPFRLLPHLPFAGRSHTSVPLVCGDRVGAVTLSFLLAGENTHILPCWEWSWSPGGRQALGWGRDRQLFPHLAVLRLQTLPI